MTAGHVSVPELFSNPRFLSLIQERLVGDEWIKNAVILGSAPSAPELENRVGDDTIVIALNNAHRAISRVDFVLYSDDLPPAHKHPRTAVIGRSSPQYSPAVQRFGGVIHCGGTMAFNAGYWAIGELPYSQISFFACDMMYESDRNHFYGNGNPDPLRRDVTLQNLAAKSLRLFYLGLCHQVLFLNASCEPRSRLRLPRPGDGGSLRRILPLHREAVLDDLRFRLQPLARRALAREAAAPFDGLRHDYWMIEDDPAVWEHVRACDALWMELGPEVAAFEATLRRLAAAAITPPP